MWNIYKLYIYHKMIRDMLKQKKKWLRHKVTGLFSKNFVKIKTFKYIRLIFTYKYVLQNRLKTVKFAINHRTLKKKKIKEHP